MLTNRFFKLDVVYLTIIGLVLVGVCWAVLAANLPMLNSTTKVAQPVADRSYNLVEQARADVAEKATGNVPAALDQHERVTSLMVVEMSIPDWFERAALRLSGQGSIPAALDQHERHTTAQSVPDWFERAALRLSSKGPAILNQH